MTVAANLQIIEPDYTDEFELFSNWVYGEVCNGRTYLLVSRRTWQEQQEDTSTDDISYLEYICRPDQSFTS